MEDLGRAIESELRHIERRGVTDDVAVRLDSHGRSVIEAGDALEEAYSSLEIIASIDVLYIAHEAYAYATGLRSAVAWTLSRKS